MSFFTRTLARLRNEDRGFGLMETVVALSVMFIALVALAHTAAVGFTDIALSRQRTQANQIANKLLEQVRGLTYERVSKGLKTSDLSADTNIVSCPGGLRYYLQCPSANPNAEEIVHLASPGDDVPLVPHVQSFGPPTYSSTYSAALYVTKALDVPVSGAFRVTALVSWTPASRGGVRSSVTTQSLLYTPEGTTDASTGGGTAPFFYGTSSIGRAPVTITPNTGVSGGTGVTGLGVWDSLTEDLYGLDATVQQQTLTRAESKAVLTGAHKVVSGVETVAGGDTAEATADDDPATAVLQDSSPASLMQSAVSTSVAGGGNALQVEAASGGVSQCVQPSGWRWGTGVETGGINGAATSSTFNPMGGMFTRGTIGLVADSTVKRSGNYSLKVDANGEAAGFWAPEVPNGTYPRNIVVKFAIRFASLPATDIPYVAYIEQLSPSGTRELTLRYVSSSQRLALGFQETNTAPVGVVNGPVITAGTWYVIDLKLDTSTNPHTAEWMVDGVAQPSTTNPQAVADIYGVMFGGSSWNGVGFTANYDDMQISRSLADYPMPDATFSVLKPIALGTHNGGSNFVNNNGTALDGTTAGRLDEIPADASSDFIYQLNASTANYAEIEFEDPTDTCIGGVRSLMSFSSSGNGAITMHGKILDGSTETCALGASNNYCAVIGTTGTVVYTQSHTVNAASLPWTQSAVSGLKARWGYADDANPDPRLHNVLLEYAVIPMSSGAEGGAGTETGSVASSTAANAGTPCGNPTQVDGRACAYAKEDYSTTGPPHLTTKLDLTGSGAGKANLYRFLPTSQSGSTSYVWGRRTAGTGGAGTIRQTAHRYPGKHEFGAFPTGFTSGVSGWPGFWIRYNAGTSAASVSAEAGVGSAPPSITSVGTISYWDGNSVETMTPPTDGTQALIPTGHAWGTFGSFRVDICEVASKCSVVSNASYTSQQPTGAVGTTTRTEARAVLGSPVAGQFTYKVTNTSTGEVLADLTLTVDLGTLTALAKYSP